MMPEKLRFRARDNKLVPHFDKEDAGTRAFVGRRKNLDHSPGRLAFEPTNEDEEVAFRHEYVKACADGDLYAADEITAQVCNVYAKAHKLPEVVFDPSFGGSVEVKKVAPPPTHQPSDHQSSDPHSSEPAHHTDAAALLETGDEPAHG